MTRRRVSIDFAGPGPYPRAMRISSLTFAFALALAACGGGAKPAAQPTPVATGDTCGVEATGGLPADAKQCECLGYQVVGDIGDGNVACPDGTSEVARISYGIEGGMCCKGGDAPAAAE